MSVVIVIPARYASSRYPGKPLVELSLPDGSRRSLIRLTWEAASAVPGIDGVLVATDDSRIRDHAEGFGARVVMTPESCRNGTERVAAAVAALTGAGEPAPEVVVNLQGDAPLTPPWFVTALLDEMAADPAVEMATPVLRCDALTYGHFVEDRRAGRVGGTTAVFDTAHDALYFSKEVIPWLDPGRLPDLLQGRLPVFHHVGIYAYRPAALAAYSSWPPGPLEGFEGLEQLRFLENGHKVRCTEVAAEGRVFWELNNPEDVARIESVLRRSA